MPVAFRLACRDDVATIVALLADDMLGSGREAQADDLDPRYLAAFEAIDRDPNQQLVVAAGAIPSLAHCNSASCPACPGAVGGARRSRLCGLPPIDGDRGWVPQ